MSSLVWLLWLCAFRSGRKMAGRLRVIGADRLTTAGNMSVSTSSAACSSSCRLSMGNARKSKSIRSIKRKSKINVRNSICISSGKRGVQSDPHICRGLVNVRPIDSGSGSCYHYFKRTNRFLIQPASSIVYNRKLSTMATTSQVEVKVNVDMEHIDLENIKRAAAVVVAEKSITPSIDSDEVGAQENSDQIYEFVKSGSVGEEDNNVIHSNTESLSVSEPPKRRKRRSVKTEKATYLLSAVAMSTLVTGLAFVCTYSRFTRHLGAGEHLPWFEINGTLLFIVGAAFAMELWALWAHRVLWHEGSLWKLHESHHKPRTGPFEVLRHTHTLLELLYWIVKSSFDNNMNGLNQNFNVLNFISVKFFSSLSMNVGE